MRPSGDATLGTRLLVVALVALTWCVGTGAGPASAFWLAPAATPGSGVAAVGSLLAPSAPSASASGSSVTLGWTASARADGALVTRYTVQRYDAQGAAQTVAGGCAGTLTGTTCTETGVPDGTWRYAVTPVLAAWTGPPSPRSSALLVDSTAPALALPVSTAVTGGSFSSGTTVWFRGAAAGSLTLSSAVTDAGSGPAGAQTSALTGTTTGWTHTPARISTPTGGPYVSNPFRWTAGTSGTAGTTVTGYDLAGNASAARTVTFTDDSAAPTGATLTYAPGATTATTLTLALGTVTDAGAGVATRSLDERTAPLSGNSCGTFSGWSTVQAVTTTSVTRPLAYGTCYDYRYVVTDLVGNSTTVTSPGVVRNRSYAAVVAATTGRLDHYRLGESSAATIADSYTATSTNNGTCTGGPTPRQTGAITGDPDTAFAFDGVNDACSVARSIGGSFSIELWFKAAGPGAGTTATWYSGAGLVGSEMLSLPSDFGVTFLANGRVCAGTGLTVSLCSTTTYLSGWHHVVFTRDTTTGAIVLYVDGTSRATGTGGLNLLSGSSTIRFGGLSSGGKYFNGTLDEVALYTTVLSATTVVEHYQTGTG